MRKVYAAFSVVVISLFSFAPLQAAVLDLEFTHSFGAVPADGAPSPWLTATFDDGGTPGSVSLFLEVGPVGAADVTEVYFNLNTLLDATDLSIVRTGGTGPSAGNIDIYTGTNAYKADGDGFYDIYFDLPPPPGNDKFEAGQTLEFAITGIGSLVAADFNYLSLDSGGAGPFLAAAHIQSTGPNGADSDWIAAVPVPATAWLFISGLGLLGWRARARSKLKA